MKTFISKPFKNMDFGRSGSWDIKGNENHAIYTTYSDLFQFIQWEDEEPHNIAELIRECEVVDKTWTSGSDVFFKKPSSPQSPPVKYKESEEAEVKNIEWAKKKIKEIHTLTFDSYEAAVIANNKHFQMKNSEQLALINKIMEILDQLDEPEVLSHEFIDEYSYNIEEYWEAADMMDGPQYAVSVENLQNLLVPKQELPVIPDYVGDFIEEVRASGDSLDDAYALLRGIYHQSRVADWMAENKKNSETFASAWLNGFTVKKEPLYRARLKVITDEFIASYLRTQSSNAEDRLKALEIGSKYIHEDYRHLSEFTEDELKRLDIWDREQWEVEELEE